MKCVTEDADLCLPTCSDSFHLRCSAAILHHGHSVLDMFVLRRTTAIAVSAAAPPLPSPLLPPAGLGHSDLAAPRRQMLYGTDPPSVVLPPSPMLPPLQLSATPPAGAQARRCQARSGLLRLKFGSAAQTAGDRGADSRESKPVLPTCRSLPLQTAAGVQLCSQAAAQGSDAEMDWHSTGQFCGEHTFRRLNTAPEHRHACCLSERVPRPAQRPGAVARVPVPGAWTRNCTLERCSHAAAPLPPLHAWCKLP